jgi:hypothetical protein
MRSIEASELLTSRYGLPPRDLPFVIDYYAHRCKELINGASLVPVFKELCARAWEIDLARGLAILPQSTVENVLKTVLQAREWAFFEQVVDHIGGTLPIGFFQWARTEVKEGRLAIRDIQKGYVRAMLCCLPGRADLDIDKVTVY